MLQTRLIPPANNAHAYPLLIKRLLLSGSRYEKTREIVYRDKLRYSYATFNERVARLANVLSEAGVKAGDTVAVMDWDSHRYLECMFAIPMLGAVESLTDSREGQTFAYKGEAYALSLLGAHQLNNAATALAVVDTLRKKGWSIPESAVKTGLAAAKWPARFEIVSKAPYFVVDGGHNPQCVATTADALERYFPHMRRVLLVGVLADKDWHSMMNTLAPLADGFVTVTPNSERALSAADLAAALEKYGKSVVCADSIPDGVAKAKAMAGADGMVCSVGSLYMAGAVRDCFDLH